VRMCAQMTATEGREQQRWRWRGEDAGGDDDEARVSRDSTRAMTTETTTRLG